MTLPTGDSSVAHSFGCEMDGIEIQNITEVSGLSIQQEVIEYKSNTATDGKYTIKKLAGRPKAGECTLIRGLTNDQSFDQWIKSAQQGDMSNARKNGAITVYDPNGNAIKRYNLLNAWPKSLELTSMKAGSTEVLTEKLVLTYESCVPDGA